MSVPPTHRVTFADNEWLDSVAYSTDSSEIYAAFNLTSVNAWRLITDYWQWTIGACVLVLGLMTIIVLARAIRRPRRPGRTYCRGCNYEITATQTRCPECGRSMTAHRAIVPGGSLRRRAGPILVAMTIIAAAYATMWTLPGWRIQSMGSWIHVWSDALLRIGRTHRISFITRLEEVRGRSRIAVIDVKSGRRLRELGTFPLAYRQHPNGDQRILAAPDGTAVFAPDTARSFVALDPRSGTVRQRFALGTHNRFADFAGLTLDGSTIYATFHDDPTNVATLARFDAITGAHSVVKSVPGDVVIHPVDHEKMRFPSRFHFMPFAPEPAFIQTRSQRMILSNELDGVPTEFGWFLESAPSDLRDFDEWIAWDSRPMPFGDGGKMLFRPSFASLFAFDPVTGQTEAVGLSFFREPPYAPINESGARRFVFGVSRTSSYQIGTYDVTTFAVVDEGILPPLEIGQPGALISITTSPDLTSRAAVVFRSTGSGGPYFYDLFIYDLTPYPKLRELEFGETENK